MSTISFENIKLIIFDVDGTLYDQSKLRKRVLLSLLKYYLLRPWKIIDLKILYSFRKEREKKAGYSSNNLQFQQYQWCAQDTNLPLERVKKVVDKWIFDFPNQYLKQFMFPDVQSFFDQLQLMGIKKAIYSDYDSKIKMKSMQLEAELLVSSTDTHIDAMKPLPNGISYILQKLGIQDPSCCLFIGDRDELDGACARNAGVMFLHIEKTKANHFYTSLIKSISQAPKLI